MFEAKSCLKICLTDAMTIFSKERTCTFDECGIVVDNHMLWIAEIIDLLDEKEMRWLELSSI